MKISLGISNFLEEISSLSHSIAFLYFFALIMEAGFIFFFKFFKFIFYFYLLLLFIFYFSILYWFCHTSTCIRHGCTRVPHPEPAPTSLPIPSLWFITVHQPQASCILHRTWTGDSCLIWYYTCFNAILPNHPPTPSPTESKRLFYTSVSHIVTVLFI